jgi:hypothetical protein
MNKETEAINQFLAWLLQNPHPTASTSSGEHFVENGRAGSETADLQFDDLDLLDSEAVMALPNDSDESNPFSIPKISSFQPGDNPAVQDRFHTLLKRRLRTEIERRPPLFPWETEVYDYQAETPDWADAKLVPATLWVAQLHNLNLPIPMPEAVLSQLFERCQEMLQSSLREGAKLVRVVETLFPDHSQTLNQLAGLVLTSPARSPLRSLQPAPGFPTDYEAATQPQQMVLSLLAAREIMNSLTLTVSPNQPQTERQWITDAGPLLLKAEYPSATGQIRVHSQLPCSGSLRIQGNEAQVVAQRSNPGSLSVELFDVAPNCIYPLEVRLANPDQPPIVFAVRPTEHD